MRSLGRILPILVCLGLAADASAQYRFDAWTTDNGLPQNGVRQMTQTPDGYLWFTTFDGLVRFDGVRFTTFGTGNTKGIINNRFTGLYGDKDGTLYATTMEDGVLTIYRNGVFTSYDSSQVPGHYIQQIEPDAKGELRFQVEDQSRTTKSWYYLRGGQFVFSEQQRPTTERVMPGKDGAVWRMTLTEAVEDKGGTRTVYPLDLTKSLPFFPNTFVDRAGNLWIGEYAVHLLSNGKVRKFAAKDGLPSSINHSFWADPDGSVWFATGGGATEGLGLARYEHGTLQFFGMNRGLLGPSIYSVFHDREGTTWVATNKGLGRLRKQVFNAYSVKDGLIHPEVYPIYRDRRDRIWIGTAKGLSIYQDGQFTSVALTTPGHPAPDETWLNETASVQSLWEDPAGHMWVGLNGGLYIVEGGQARMQVAAKTHHVFAIRGDRHGNVWAASNKGLLLFRDGAYVKTLSVSDGLPNEFLTTIFEDSKGTLWIGGFGGLTKFVDGVMTNYTVKQGLVGSYVRSIYEDRDGTLWIGTYNEGLSRFRDGRFANITAGNGLSNNGVFAIEEDARGNFWISSNRGIYRVKRQELNDYADGKLPKVNSISYGTQDGMLSTECDGGRQPASMTDKDGRFWFPTQDGVVVVDPSRETYNSVPPSVVIESATVERQPVEIREGLTIAPGLKNVEIHFAGVSLIKSEQIKFRYKLEGHDPDWIEGDTGRTAYYSFLPPGHYRFLVKAANSDDLWNEEGASLAVELKPFFYQTTWFSMLCVLGAAVVLFGAWKTSSLRYQTREQQLAALVAEKTEALRKANEELRYLAHSDEMTAVANRRRFDEFLGDEWRRAVRFKTEISLVLLDIDHFKLFNDTYGHQAGDECLKQVAAALKETIHRPTDLLARFGGEEFAIVLGGTDRAGAVKVAELALAKIRSLRIPHSGSKTDRHLTVSAGVATTMPVTESNEADFVKAADQALYRAKAGGRNQIAS